MKTGRTLAIASLFTCLTPCAFSGEQGRINQANPLDATMRFYLHPAHLYLSSEAPRVLGDHPAVAVKRNEAMRDAGLMLTTVQHPALLRSTGRPVKMTTSQAAPVYP
jgi:hypothetical protein